MLSTLRLNIEEYLKEEGGYTEVVSIASPYKGQHYAAVTEKVDGMVRVKAVVLLERRESEAKLLSEDDAVASYCPASILDLLSPTDNVAVLRWRLRCRAFNLREAENRVVGFQLRRTPSQLRDNPALKRITKTLYRERASYEQAMKNLSRVDFEEFFDIRGEPITCTYFVKYSATTLEDGRMYVVFDGIGKAAAFYIPANTYMLWPDACFPTVADYSLYSNLSPAPLKLKKTGNNRRTK